MPEPVAESTSAYNMCTRCGIRFTGNHNSWCPDCRVGGDKLSLQERLCLAICEDCSLPFAYERRAAPKKRFCSANCRRWAYYGFREPRDCLRCKKSFRDLSQAGQKKYCSELCRKSDSKTRQRYGLSRDEHDILIGSGVCAACGEPERGKMSIDHCHASGRVRGWVHQSCNVGLAQAGDSIEKLKSWIKYLEANV